MAQEFMYVLTEENESLYLVSPSDNKVSRVITKTDGKFAGPCWLAVARNGLAYVFNQETSTVSVVDPDQGKALTVIKDQAFGTKSNLPAILAASPTSDRVFVLDQEDASVAVIDTTSNSVIKTLSKADLKVGKPVAMAVSPRGMVYLLDTAAPTAGVVASVFDELTYAVAKPVTGYTMTTGELADLAFSADGKYCWIANSAAPTVRVSTETSIVESTLTDTATLSACAIGCAESGKLYLATTHSTRSFVVVDGMTGKILAEVNKQTGHFNWPGALSLSPDEKLAYVTNYDSNNVSVISCESNSYLASITVGSHPTVITAPRAPQPAKLELTEPKATPDVLIAGEKPSVDVVYSWTLADAGPGAARDLTITVTAPAGTTFKAPQQDWTLSEGNRTATRGISALAANGRVPLSITVAVPTPADAADNLRYTAVVKAESATTKDATDRNKYASATNGTATATLAGRAALSLTPQTPSPNQVTAGEPAKEIRYAWTLKNAGPSVARAVTVTVVAPDGMTFAAPQQDWRIPIGGKSASRVIDTLMPGTPATLTITASVAAGPEATSIGPPTISAASTTKDAENHPATASDNTAAISVVVKADLVISEARAYPVMVRPGSDLQYAWRVTNEGPSTAAAKSVTIRITLPDGVSPHPDFKVEKDSGGYYAITVNAPLKPKQSGWVSFYATVAGSAVNGSDASATAVPRWRGQDFAPKPAKATVSRDGSEVKVPPKGGGGGGFWGWLGALLGGLGGLLVTFAGWLTSAPIPASGSGGPSGDNSGDDSDEDEDKKDKRTRLGFVDPKASAEKVVTGGEVTWSWTLKNTGRNPAYGVFVTVTLPPEVTVKTTSPGGVAVGSMVTYAFDELAANGTKDITVTTQVSDNAGEKLEAVADAAAVNATNPRKTLTVAAMPRVTVTGTVLPDHVVPGRQLTYVWTVTNHSTKLSAGDVTLTSPLPTGTTFVQASNKGSVAGQTVTWPATLLAAGKKITDAVTAELAPDATSVTAATATATGTRLAAPVTSASVQPVIDARQTTITLEAASEPTEVSGGTSVTYVITVTNTGPSTLAGGATLVLTPESATPLSSATIQVGQGPQNTAPLADDADKISKRVTLPALPPGTLVVRVTAAVVPAATGTVYTWAKLLATPSASEPVAQNVAQLHILSDAHLTLDLAAASSSVTAGEQVTFTATVGLTGTRGVPIPRLELHPQHELEIVSLTAGAKSFGLLEVRDGGMFDLGPLEPGKSLTATITAMVLPECPKDSTLTLWAQAKATGATPSEAKTASVSVSVRTNVTVTVKPPASGTPKPVPGGTAQMAWQVTNTGPSLARAATVSLPQPQQFIFQQVTVDGHPVNAGTDGTTRVVTLTDLYPRKTMTVGVTGHVAPTATSPIEVTATAVITDPANGGTGKAIARLDLDTTPHLTITQVTDPKIPVGGQNLSYLWTITNTGTTVTAANTTFAVTITGAGFTLDQGSIMDGTYNAATHTVTWTVGALAPQQQRSYLLTGELAGGAQPPTVTTEPKVTS